MNLNVSVYNTSVYPLKTVLLTALGITIDCNGDVQTNTNSHTFSITSGDSITLVVSKSGYKTYTNTFTAYEGLPSIDLELFLEPEIVDSSDPDYIKVFPNFTTIPIPGTYNFLVLDLTSNTSYIKYYLDKQVISEVRNFTLNLFCLGNHEIIQELYSINSTTSEIPVWWSALGWWNSLTGDITNYYMYETGVQINPFDLTLYDILNIYPIEYKPENTISSVVTNNGCASTDCNCIPQEATVTVTPDVVINDNATIFDTPCTTSTLVYNLYNYSGTLIDTLTYTIVNADPIDNTTLTYDFTLSEIGDYTLKVLLTNCYTTCEIDQVYHVCNFIKITEDSCHAYTISNCSNFTSSDSLVTVMDLDNNILTGYNDVTLTHGTSITLTTPSDGLYIVIIKNSEDQTITEQFVLLDICDLTNCLQTKIQELLCDCDCKQNTVDCTDYCKKRYTLNAIEALVFSLFNKINKLYSLNSIYTTFDASTLSELTTMQDYIEAINSYCGCTPSNGNGLTIFNTTSKSNCGCS